MAYHLFESYGLIDRLALNRRLLCNFFVAVEHGSNINGNYFHSSVHAADMLQVCASLCECFLFLNESASRIRSLPHSSSSPVPFTLQACHLLIVDLHLASRLSDFDILSVFLAAIIHNYRHPGLTNQYLMASQDSLSLLYNDVKPVENFACSSAFRLLAEPGNDFFSSFDPVTRQKVRQQIVALVFATNLADHAYFLGALFGDSICMLQTHPTHSTSSVSFVSTCPVFL